MLRPSRSHLHRGALVLALLAVCGLALTVRGITAPAPPPGLDIRSGHGDPFDPGEQQRIINRVLNHPQVAPKKRGHRLRVLRVVEELVPKERAPRGKRVAAVILFDYTDGKGERYRLDTSSGNLLSQEVLPGRPQPSEEEIEEATRIIGRDPVHQSLLQAGSVLSGGFVVSGPAGTPATHRFLFFHLLSADQQQLRRRVIVDLTAAGIASSTPP